MLDQDKVSDKSSAEQKPKKSVAKPKSAAPKTATDKELVAGLKKVQKRKLTNDEFSAVSRTIALLDKE